MGERELYERICAYDFDEDAPFPFSMRLARENGWSRAYTARVITEYRRFVFLAITAGHFVSPSDPVDQAWHLHLLYTKSYWGRFCGEMLQRPLHHVPGTGGADEHALFQRAYEHTLATYREVFGHEAPDDIWPPPDVRFDRDVRHERVDTGRSWVISKPWSRGGRRS